eukprot:UN2452
MLRNWHIQCCCKSPHSAKPTLGKMMLWQVLSLHVVVMYMGLTLQGVVRLCNFNATPTEKSADALHLRAEAHDCRVTDSACHTPSSP